jgi:hypothetical protein
MGFFFGGGGGFTETIFIFLVFAHPSTQILQECVKTGYDNFHVHPNLYFIIMLQLDELLLGNQISQTDHMTVNSPTFSKNQEFIAVFTKAPIQVLGPVPNLS